MKNAIALIPARGGSKGIPRKNLVPLKGYPLIAYAIAASKLTPEISRTIVVTDDEEVGETARRFGAETPFVEPAELAGDRVRDIEWISYTLGWLKEHEGKVAEYIVELRPTTPLRRPEDLSRAIAELTANGEATSLRSGYEIHEPPQKLFGIDEAGYFHGLYPNDPRPEYYNLPRQTFPSAYQPDGYVDILRASHIERTGNQHGENMLAFPTHDTVEIDAPRDLRLLKFLLEDERWEIYEWLKSNFPQT